MNNCKIILWISRKPISKYPEIEIMHLLIINLFLFLSNSFARNLTQIIEQNKRKHQNRVRKLEQKLMELTMQNERKLHSSNRNCYQQQQQQDVNEADILNVYKSKHSGNSSEQHLKSPPEICVPETTL